MQKTFVQSLFLEALALHILHIWNLDNYLVFSKAATGWSVFASGVDLGRS